MRVEYFAQMAIGDMKPKGSTEILLASLAEKPEPEYFLLSHDTETAYRRHFG